MQIERAYNFQISYKVKDITWGPKSRQFNVQIQNANLEWHFGHMTKQTVQILVCVSTIQTHNGPVVLLIGKFASNGSMAACGPRDSSSNPARGIVVRTNFLN